MTFGIKINFGAQKNMILQTNKCLKSLSYGTFFRVYGKLLPKHGIESAVAIIHEKLWSKQGLGHFCTFWIILKQPVIRRCVDEASAVNYPRGGLPSMKVSGRRLQNWSTPKRRVSQRTHPQDTIAIPHHRCEGLFPPPPIH